VIAKLWRSYFHPPRDTGDFGWDCEKKQLNKLIAEGPQDSRALRRTFRVVG
jgi:hypothetical protein